MHGMVNRIECTWWKYTCTLHVGTIMNKDFLILWYGKHQMIDKTSSNNWIHAYFPRWIINQIYYIQGLKIAIDASIEKEGGI